jgi:hypothetical protein
LGVDRHDESLCEAGLVSIPRGALFRKAPIGPDPFNRKVRYLSTGRRLFVTKNRRLTFPIGKTEIEMIDLKRDDGLKY